MGKRKLLLSGSSVAELRKECEEFLRETAGTVGPEYPYPPAPTTHGLPDEDYEFGDVDEPGAYGPFE